MAGRAIIDESGNRFVKRRGSKFPRYNRRYRGSVGSKAATTTKPIVFAIETVSAEARPSRPMQPNLTTSQRRSIAHCGAPDAFGAMRSRGPDQIRPNFVRLPP
jgi:hypothetical protein